ncbi:hypothetical protein FB451DRAFT_780703 [Mycena latifolia]|nr:hypothetical protein FB451DRAFT_780703 [Mycena latifolia]
MPQLAEDLGMRAQSCVAARVLRLRKPESRRSEVPSRTEDVIQLPRSVGLPGEIYSRIPGFSTNTTLTFLPPSDSALISASHPFISPILLIIARPCWLIRANLTASSSTNALRAATLALSLAMRSNLSLGRSKPPHSLSFQSRISLIGFAWSRTFPSPVLRLCLIHPLIHLSTPTSSLPPGAHSPLSHYLPGASLLALKGRVVTSPRLIVEYPYTLHSGRRLLYAPLPLPSISTSLSLLGRNPDAALLDPSRTLALIFIAPQAWDHYQSGLMITFFFAFAGSTSPTSTACVSSATSALRLREAATTLAADSGLVVISYPTDALRNSTRTCLSPFAICPTNPLAQPTTVYSPIISTTSMPFPSVLEYPGNCRKTTDSPAKFLSRGSFGISNFVLFPSGLPKRRSTFWLSRNGPHRRRMPSTPSRNCTGSSYMRHLSSQWDALTSPTWKPCWGSSTIVLTSRVPPLPALQTICSGGSQPSLAPYSPAPSLVHVRSLTVALSRTPVQVPALLSWSTAIGAHGGYSPVGTPQIVALDGQKPSASNSFATPSLAQPAHHAHRISSSMVITPELSKAGGTTAAATAKQTQYSAESTRSLQTAVISSTHDMFQPIRIPPIIRRAANTRLDLFSFHPSQSLLPSQITSLISTPLGRMQRTPSGVVRQHRQSPPSRERAVPHQIRSLIPARASSSATNSAGGTGREPPQRPHPYRRGLVPNASPLRPHCLARDRLRLWLPLAGRSSHASPLADSDLSRILDVLVLAWAEGTTETYGSGLLSFHVFCDSKSVPEASRAPAGPTLVAGYISALAGFLSGSTISSYVSGVRAWHLIHGVNWLMNKPELEALLRAADRLTPSSSKRQARMPYTVEILCLLRPFFDLTKPLDAAVWSCLTTLFWSTSRGGEFTVKTLTSFDPAIHVKPSDVSRVADRNGLEQTNFALPRTKSAPHGENVYWAKQNGPSDPEAALANHLTVNTPRANDALFSHLHGSGRRPLTKTAFKRRLTEAFKAANIQFIHVHGIRIGSTLEYLLRGIPLDVMKAKGRWASDAFSIYLRRHAQIMAPYMQAEPQLHASILRIMMPRVR